MEYRARVQAALKDWGRLTHARSYTGKDAIRLVCERYDLSCRDFGTHLNAVKTKTQEKKAMSAHTTRFANAVAFLNTPSDLSIEELANLAARKFKVKASHILEAYNTRRAEQENELSEDFHDRIARAAQLVYAQAESAKNFTDLLLTAARRYSVPTESVLAAYTDRVKAEENKEKEMISHTESDLEKCVQHLIKLGDPKLSTVYAVTKAQEETFGIPAERIRMEYNIAIGRGTLTPSRTQPKTTTPKETNMDRKNPETSDKVIAQLDALFGKGKFQYPGTLEFHVVTKSGSAIATGRTFHTATVSYLKKNGLPDGCVVRVTVSQLGKGRNSSIVYARALYLGADAPKGKSWAVYGTKRLNVREHEPEKGLEAKARFLGGRTSFFPDKKKSGAPEAHTVGAGLSTSRTPGGPNPSLKETRGGSMGDTAADHDTTSRGVKARPNADTPICADI